MEWILAVLCLSLFIHPSSAQCPQGCFGCRPGATRITCTNVGLSAFPEIPQDQRHSVTHLNLRSNPITSLSAMDLEGFTNLTALDFSFNMLSTIEPGTFDNVVSLQELDLADNQLTEIPDDLFKFNSLIRLDLSQNYIGNISSATFNGLKNFSTIFLSNNVIRRISDGTFSQLGTIVELSLLDNPLLCDCGLRWLPAFLSDNSPLIPLVGACDVPTRLNGNNLRSLIEDDLVCECSPMCVNGSCILSTGECLCDDRFIGNDCSTECSAGTYGTGCLNECNCVPEHESSPRDHIDGTCHCRPGYTGASCEEECPDGSYGQDCLEVCQCQNGASCDTISSFCNCTIGFIGMFCESECDNGTYGPGCQYTCICEAEHTMSCNHFNGRCNCEAGYSGRHCEIIRITTTTTDDSPSTLSVGALAGIVVGGTIIASIIIIVILVLLTTLFCLLAKNGRPRNKVTQILVQSISNFKNIDSGSHESGEYRALSKEGSREGFSYSDSPPDYENVIGEKETTSVETPNHCDGNGI